MAWTYVLFVASDFGEEFKKVKEFSTYEEAFEYCEENVNVLCFTKIEKHFL